MRHRPRKLPLSALALAALVGQARAQPTAEVGIAHPVARADPRDQIVNGLGAGPDGWLVVWTTDNEPGMETYAARIDATGTILDPQGIALGVIADERVQIGWDGTQWLIVRSGGGIYGQTVSADGVAGAPFVITGSGATLRWPSMACRATDCMVAWWRFEQGVGHSVRLARIAGGAVVATDLPTTVATTDAHEPAISWDGSNYLVVWRDIRRPDGGDIYGARISPTGALVGSDFPISMQAGIEDQPAVVWNGTHHMVAWRDARNGPAQLYAARVTAAGTVEAADATGVLIEVAPGADPRIAWTGSEHVVSWQGGAIRLSAGGAVLGALAVPATARHPVVAVSGGSCLISYRDQQTVHDDWEVFASRMTGATLEPRRWVAGIASTENTPAAAYDGTNHLLIWHDQRDGSDAIYGTRVDGDGNGLDGPGFRISDDGVVVKSAVVAWSGSSYLVVWARRSIWVPASFKLEARRVASDGTVIDVDPIVIQDYVRALGTEPGLAMVWNGQSYLIVYQGDEYIQGIRVGADGQVLDAQPFGISTEVDQARSPALAWNGTVHLAVWYDHRNDGSWIYGARLGLDGRPLDAQNVYLGKPASYYAFPTVAGSEHGFLAGAGEARRFDANGTLIDEDPLDLEGLEEQEPLLVWDGAGYVVAWSVISTFGGYASYYRARRIGLLGERLGNTEQLAMSPAIATTDSIRPIVVPSGSGKSSFFYPLRVNNSDPLLLQEVHLNARTWTGFVIEVDAGVEPPDAGTGGGDGDAGPGRDAQPIDGDGGGGCSGGSGGSGGSPSGSIGLALLLLALGHSRARRKTVRASNA